jgi:hypothetical protein
MPEDLTQPELGALTHGRRALVFATEAGESHLKVDVVRGVRPILLGDLRRLPAAVNAARFTMGVCLDQTRLVLLIDLVETVKAQGRH